MQPNWRVAAYIPNTPRPAAISHSTARIKVCSLSALRLKNIRLSLALGLCCRCINPRVKKRLGKPDHVIKYETPDGARMCLDCPPRCQPLLADPSEPLWITEGIKKADAGASHGACIISLIGIWNWRGANEFEGIAALGDWDAIPLKARHGSRTIFICFDSDIATNLRVQQAEERLGRFLESRGASVRLVRIPAGVGNE
jgi:hypothetical protein